MFCVHNILDLLLFKLSEDVLVFDKVNSIDNHKTHRLVAAKERIEASRSQIELNCIHAWKDSQVLEYCSHKVVFVCLNLRLSGSRPKDFLKVVLFVNIAHFFHELASAELTLNVKKYALQLLTLRDRLYIFVSCSSGVSL